MTTHASKRSAPLATKGDANELVTPTSLLLTIPEPAATKPLVSVARPMIVDNSGEETPDDEAADMSQDSKAENRMDVDTPPMRRPRRRIGIEGIMMQTHARVYVTQKARQSLLRPL